MSRGPGLHLNLKLLKINWGYVCIFLIAVDLFIPGINCRSAFEWGPVMASLQTHTAVCEN